MSNFTLEFSGVKEFQDKIDIAIAELPEEALAVMRKSADRVEAKTAQNTPVLTGYLQSRVQVRWLSESGEEIAYELFNDAEYAMYVEFGTTHMKAEPYFNPSVEDERHQLVQDIIKLVRKVLS